MLNRLQGHTANAGLFGGKLDDRANLIFVDAPGNRHYQGGRQAHAIEVFERAQTNR